MVASSASSFPSSSSSHSSGHFQLEQKATMVKFEHLHLHHAPPPPHCRSKKHHHPYPYPPPPPHRRHHFVGHPDDHSRPMERRPLSPLNCSPHHRHKKDKLRVKPPKHLRKVRKVHRKLMKAYRLPKNARHGCHYHHYIQFSPPKKGFFRHHHHPPGCCMRSMEEERFSMEEQCRVCEMSFHRHQPRCHGGPPHQSCIHEICSKRSLIKSEIVRGKVAVVSPRLVQAPGKPSIEGAAPVATDRARVGDPTTDVPPVDDPVPVLSAP